MSVMNEGFKGHQTTKNFVTRWVDQVAFNSRLRLLIKFKFKLVKNCSNKFLWILNSKYKPSWNKQLKTTRLRNKIEQNVCKVKIQPVSSQSFFSHNAKGKYHCEIRPCSLHNKLSILSKQNKHIFICQKGEFQTVYQERIGPRFPQDKRRHWSISNFCKTFAFLSTDHNWK